MLYVTRKRTSTGEGIRSSRSSTRPARYEEQEKNVGVQRAERGRERGGGGRPKTSRERKVLEYRGLNVGGTPGADQVDLERAVRYSVRRHACAETKDVLFRTGVAQTSALEI